MNRFAHQNWTNQPIGLAASLRGLPRVLLTWLLFVTVSASAFAAAPVITAPADTTILEDAARTNLTFTVTDADTPVFLVSVTASSSNTNLVADADIVVVGSGTSRTLRVAPSADASGSSTITLVASDGSNSATNSFVLTVTAVNDAPAVGSISDLTILEDAGKTNLTISIADVDSPLSFVTVTAVSADTNLVNATVTGSSTNRILALTTVTNANGATTVSVIANDGFARSTNTFAVTVTPVADAPKISGLAALSIVEDRSTNRTFLVRDVDTDITNVVVTATSSNTNIVTVSTSGTATNRTITFNPATNAVGTATISVVADNGGKSATNSFVVTVTPVNDPPSFTLSTNVVTAGEDLGLITIPSLATAISPGPADEAAQKLTFLVKTTNAAFFAVAPAISTNGTLTFRTATNRLGTNEISIVLKDSGPAANGGVATSLVQTVSIVITNVNDAPVISGISAFSIREDAGTTNKVFHVTDLDTAIGSVTVTAASADTNLFDVSVSGSTTNRTLTITTVTNANGSARITLIADDGTDKSTNSFILTVTPVNDRPSFTLSTNLLVIAEDAGAVSVPAFATSISTGPADESAQTNKFTLTAAPASFFASVPVMTPDGTLNFTVGTNKFGTNTISVVMKDSGGVQGGGSDTTLAQTFKIIVTNVVDGPAMGGLTNFTIAEDAAATKKNFLLTDPDVPIASVVVTAISSDTNMVKVAVSGTTTNRTMTVTAVTNANGSATITLVANDGTAQSTNSVTVTVTPVNDIPVISGMAAFSINEDSGPTNKVFQVLDADTPITNVIVTATASNTNLIDVSVSGTTTNRTLTVTPLTNAFGSATIKLVADDGTGKRTNAYTITVKPVNDQPTFTLATNLVTVAEEAGAVTITNFVSSLSSGPTNESAQTMSFALSTTNATFFSKLPTLTTNGVLSFTVATNRYGTNLVSVALKDNGGLANGGNPTSVIQVLTIVVTNINDAPVLGAIASLTIKEDAAATNKTFTVTDIDTAITNVTVTATSSDTNLVTLNVTGTSTNRTLTITTLTNANGSATISLVADDGTATKTNSFTLTVTPINDRPVFTLSTNLLIVAEDSGAASLTNFVAGISPGAANESTQTVSFVISNSNASLFTAAPAISTNGLLTFTPVTNKFGTNIVTIKLKDDGGTSNGGLDTSLAQTLTLIVTNVDDAPVISGISAFTINEDAGVTNVTFQVSDLDNTISGVTLTAISGDTNLFTVSVSGTTTNRTLTITTVTNAAGATNITLIADDGTLTSTNSFVLTVSPVNDAPVIADTAALTILEDAAPTNITVQLADVDNAITNVTLTATSADTNIVTVAASGTGTNRTVAITTVTNANGATTITLVANDGSATTTNSIAITVTPVNDAPSFTLSINALTYAEDAGVITVASFATAISSGPSNESSQTNTFILTTSDDTFYAALPTLSAAGTLSFQAASNAFGTNVISIVLQDSGGVTNGGADTSAVRTVSIIITNVNDAPVISGTTNLTIFEDAGATNTTFQVTDIDTLSSNVTVSATSGNTNLVTVSVSGTTTNRTLTLTTVTNANGSATITLVANDGSDHTTNSFTVTVLAVNDAPSFALSTNLITLGEDAGAYTLANFATNISNGPSDESSDTNQFVLTVTNAAFFATQPALATDGTLTFEVATNVFGTNVISIVLQDSGGTNNGGADTSAALTLSIVVTNINDAPVISGTTNLTILEDAAATNVTFQVDDIDTAVTNVTITATSANTNLVTVSVSGTTTNRTLTVNSVTNANGSATITLVANDGAASSTNTLTVTVTAVNDAPTFTIATNLVTIAEDLGAYTFANFATNISNGPADESADTSAFTLSTADTNFFSVQPAIAGNGTLSFTVATNVFGTNVISIVLQDNGGTNNGGSDTSAVVTFSVVVTNINDAPVISGTTNLTILEDAGTTNITFQVDDVDTALSGVTISAATSDTNLVSVSVSGSSTNRTLAITTLANANGSATITLVATDGTDPSTNTFTLTVTAVNDAPSFTLSTNNVVIKQFDTTTTLTNFLTGLSAGPTNESSQIWSFALTAADTNFFTVQPAISTNGTLTFKAADSYGSSIVTVVMRDSGGTNNGGIDIATNSFTVTVPANPYPYLVGQFNGLFFDTNGVVNASAGFMNFVLTNSGAYTGYILLDGGSNTFTGQFDVAGNTTATITRTNGNLAVKMAMDISSAFTETATGTISNGTWTAALTVDHAQFSADLNPAPQAGTYTLTIPGTTNGPAGSGYGTVVVGDDGIATLTGSLADDTAIAQAVSISKDGTWPLYVSLYGGKGCLVSWITFTNETSSDLTGNASWVKDSTAGGTYYPSGFTNDVVITGSWFEEPALNVPVLSLSSAWVILSGGNLSTAITNAVTLNADSTITVDSAATNGLSLSINLTSGVLSGQFVDPATQATNQLKGVVLQLSTNAAGYFLGTNQSGSIILR